MRFASAALGFNRFFALQWIETHGAQRFLKNVYFANRQHDPTNQYFLSYISFKIIFSNGFFDQARPSSSSTSASPSFFFVLSHLFQHINRTTSPKQSPLGSFRTPALLFSGVALRTQVCYAVLFKLHNYLVQVVAALAVRKI